MTTFFRKKTLFLSFLSFMTWVLAGNTAALCADYYEGKIITIIAATAPGGGTDMTARAVARFLPKYLPG